VEVCACAKGPPSSSDNSYPERLILVKPLPNLGNLTAGGLVDAVKFWLPVYGDLDHTFVGEGHPKVFVLERPGTQRHGE
jgi:hypothetical protein